jgi:dihydroxy-acid dehydratase
VVLHVSPEAAVGGALALVRDGDEIELDVDARRLELLVSESELAARRSEWRAPPPVVPPGGYANLYIKHVQGADTGADFDFLIGSRGHDVPRDSH